MFEPGQSRTGRAILAQIMQFAYLLCYGTLPAVTRRCNGYNGKEWEKELHGK